MRIKILSVLAAVALVAACETASTETGKGSGSGAAAQKPATTSTQMAAPAGIMPGSQQDLVVNVGDRVFFDFDKFNVRPDQQATLNKQVAWLKANPSVTVVIEGHCDERGTREYNLALGERRANAVKDFVVAAGVNPERVKTLSYGKERPVALGSNDEAWSQNRRGVTKVSGAGS